ncbi:MAG: class I SAM-dependent methyltransferase [Chloroflexota bacterium]
MLEDLTYAESLLLASRVTQPAIRQAMGDLAVPAGSTGLDIGCGAGQQTMWLAETAGPSGRVVGVDVDPANLAVARGFAADSPIGERLSFVQGELLRLPFRDGSFDWLWCADTLWPVAVVADPAAALRELACIVRVGGTVALAYWSSQHLLPGYPGLEARLNAAFTETVPYLGDLPPHLHFLRALGWLRAAGLERPEARTYVAEVRAPFGPGVRESLAYCLSMLWSHLEGKVSAEDWAVYRRLSDPESEDYLLDDPDYYGFVTYTLFTARVPA